MSQHNMKRQMYIEREIDRAIKRCEYVCVLHCS